MADYIGAKCPVCGQRFNEGDDIVVCPDCGAPYHRVCYRKEGRCILEDRHGHEVWSDEAARQEEECRYDGAAARRCPKCGASAPAGGIFCQICGYPLREGAVDENDPGPAPISPNAYTTPFGGVSPDEELDGVSVRDLALYVGENSHYFIPKFKGIVEGTRLPAWNWPALFFRGFYFLYRKMYGTGLLLLLLTALLGLPDALYSFALVTGFNPVSQFNLPQMGQLRLICNLAAFGLSFFCSTFFNRLYCRRALRDVRRLRERFGGDVWAQEYIMALSRKGRTNRGIITAALVCSLLLPAAMALLVSVGVF